METIGDYHLDGFALVKALIPREVAQAFLQGLKNDIGDAPIALSGIDRYPDLLTRPAFEVYGHHYKPMLYFLWGLTPIVSSIVGRDLLPTYDYLRIYREGDTCRVHCDRESCEHSLSLTLDYSDGANWPLEIATGSQSPSSQISEGFEGQPYGSLSMDVGDAALYQGVHHRHGRVTPNPNFWSAHLFLHWVDRNGPFRAHAFDGQMNTAAANFRFT